MCFFFFIFRNIAEALISKGLAYCLRHKQDDDQRSSQYDELMAAEARYIPMKFDIKLVLVVILSQSNLVTRLLLSTQVQTVAACAGVCDAL